MKTSEEMIELIVALGYKVTVTSIILCKNRGMGYKVTAYSNEGDRTEEVVEEQLHRAFLKILDMVYS